MGMLGEIFGFIAVFLVCWLGVGSGLVYVIHIFQFQIPFSRIMVHEGVYDAKTHRNVLTTKWVGGAVTLGGSSALAIWLGLRAGTMGAVMAGLGILVGFIRGRHLLVNQRGNVVRFVRTHLICMDRKKLAAFLKREYDLDLNQLAPQR